jgi:hypothetical protein
MKNNIHETFLRVRFEKFPNSVGFFHIVTLSTRAPPAWKRFGAVGDRAGCQRFSKEKKYRYVKIRSTRVVQNAGSSANAREVWRGLLKNVKTIELKNFVKGNKINSDIENVFSNILYSYALF